MKLLRFDLKQIVHPVAPWCQQTGTDEVFSTVKVLTEVPNRSSSISNKMQKSIKRKVLV